MEISKELGKGAYGSVYEVKGNSAYAIKKLDLNDSDMIRSMLIEIVVMKLVDHPNIMKCQGYNFSNGSIEFYMIKYPISLLDYLQNLRQKKIYLDTKIINKMLMDILNGLDYLHTNNILHLDLSDDNIMLDSNYNCVITDFGLSDVEYKKELFTNGRKQKFPVIKNPFASPEVLEESYYNSKADIWSFGVLMSKMFSFRYIFKNLDSRSNQLNHIEKNFFGLEDKERTNFLIQSFLPREVDHTSVYVCKSEVTITHVSILNKIFRKDMSERPTTKDIMKYLNYYEWVWESKKYENNFHINPLRSFLISSLNNNLMVNQLKKVIGVIKETSTKSS